MDIIKIKTPKKYDDKTMAKDFKVTNSSTESTFTVSPTSLDQIGDYEFKFVLCLEDYKEVCQSFNTKFTITCLVTSYDMILLTPKLDQTYIVGDQEITWDLKTKGLTTQKPECGLSEDFLVGIYP